MDKRKLSIVIFLSGFVLLVLGIFGFQAMSSKQMNAAMSAGGMPPVVVASATAETASWSEGLDAVGTLVAVNGTNVTTEVGGVVSRVAFESGGRVQAGDVLIELDASTERAQLRALQATRDLARAQYQRFRELSERQLVAAADLDTRRAEAEQAAAQVAAQEAMIAKKTIRAPFSGELGIRRANLGQYLSPGDAIVSLQALDPILVNFNLPEQRLGTVQPGQALTLTVDSAAGTTFRGEVTAIEPDVDAGTRNFEVQGRLANADGALRPGGFARVALEVGEDAEVVAVPQTALSFASFGNSVYVLEPLDAERAAAMSFQGQTPTHVATQRFVRTGAVRGDRVAVIEGLQPGEVVAAGGLLRLRNGAGVIINDAVEIETSDAPTPANG